ACNDAVQKIQRESQERMSGMAESLGLPPGMKLPF
ncbi:MAG: YbaB/EbfC family nucleoid-associated protein, partial [Halorhodospira sp.]